MILWHTLAAVLPVSKAYPRLKVVSAERQDHPRYRFAGVDRQGEYHLLMKFSLAGEGRLQLRDAVHPVPAGRMFCCLVHDPEIVYSYPPEASEPWEFLYCCFGGDPAVPMGAEFIRRHGHIHAFDHRHPVLEHLCSWQEGPRAERALTPEASLELFARILDMLLARTPQTSDPGAQLYLRARESILARRQDPLDISGLARSLGVSREHLCRSFQRHDGQPPYRALMRLKLLAACRELKETERPVAEVGNRYGFADPAQFAKVFTRIFGLSPRSFRRSGVVPLA